MVLRIDSTLMHEARLMPTICSTLVLERNCFLAEAGGEDGTVGGTGTIYATSSGERKQPYIPGLDNAKVLRIVST
ncbi:MAG: hypothetical protein MRK01_14725 [Candidatus Scalindua sp.]|nr:hypothetical protein [Candidatus Scalindua sp.]